METKKEPPTESKTAKDLVGTHGESGSFIVQIGSYREEATAQSSINRLNEKGYQAQLKTKEIPEKGGKWFRVRIGPFKTKTEAEKILKKLEHDGFQAVVLENN